MSAGLSRRALLRAFVDVRDGDLARNGDLSVAKGLESKGLEPVARVAMIGPDCVEPKGVSCRRCGEVCDENAIRFAPLPGGKARPLLDPVMCSGCGECLAPCPVNAISLVARAQSVLALQPALEAHP